MAKSRRPLVLAVGAGAAVLVAVGVAAAVLGLRREQPVATLDPATPAPARRLTLEVARDARSDVGHPLRCFVAGKFVGLETVAACAQKNGVDPKSLEVGLDQTGEPAAGESVQIQPAPAARVVADRVSGLQPPPRLPELDPTTPAATGDGGATGDCLRYGAGWSSAGRGVALNQCVRILFDRRCLQPGQALYGRWATQTVRAIPGRVEISDDNRSFRPLIDEDPADCSVPPA